MNFKYKIGTLLYLYKCTYFVSVWPSFSQWANLVQNRYTYFVPILYPEIVPILYFILVWVEKTGVWRGIQYSCHDALSVRAFARCAWLRVGHYLKSRVTRESLANFAQSSRKREKSFVKHARRESDMRDLYNLNNLAHKVCCKKMFHVEFSCPPDLNMYVKFDCIDYCLVPPSIRTSYM